MTVERTTIKDVANAHVYTSETLLQPDPAIIIAVGLLFKSRIAATSAFPWQLDWTIKKEY